MKTIDKAPSSLITSKVQSPERTSFYVKICRFFGFEKGYNFPLFMIFGGAMLGFVFARFQYLNIKGVFAKNASIGEWYWYRGGHYRIGIMLHLSCCLPAGFLMVWQFVPKIRHKFLAFHRVNGYIVIALVLLSNTGALMIARRSFGGDLSSQSAVGFLVVLSTVSIGMAYFNIKRLQVDQHRAWMLRAMFYLGVIITERILLIISALIISSVGSYYSVMECNEVAFINHNHVKDITTYMQNNYPICFIAPGDLSATPGSSMLNNHVAVHSDLTSSQLENVGSSLRNTFGSTIWLALMLHAIGVELYLALTPRESQRLRQVSYQKQMEAGMSNPGGAGLVPENFGDAECWTYGGILQQQIQPQTAETCVSE